MRFNLVDRIVAVEPGKSIRVVKNLTLGEEYLADHFPTFPVMPGVLMLETLVEAGAWLIRITDDFKDSMVVLREAKGVKYGNFMEPGRSLEASVELQERTGNKATFKAKGEMEGVQTVSARFTLEHYNLKEKSPSFADSDNRITSHWKNLYTLLCQPRTI